MYAYGEPKVCTKCKREFPATEQYYYRDKYQHCGWSCWCKKCKNATRDRWTRENAGHIRAYKRQWRQENRQHIIAQKRERRHRTKCHIIYKFNREARVNKAGEFTTDHWKALLRHYAPDGTCLCCGHKRELTVDHVIPLSLGGPNTVDNLQPLCQECNSAKYTRTADYRPDDGAFAKALADSLPHQLRLPLKIRPIQLELPLDEAA